MRKTVISHKFHKKPLMALAASIIIVAIMLGGTFAWTDFTQSRANKFRGSTDADVTLHDEFDGENKDVFVENSGSQTIYVRLRLDEYMEIGGTSFVAASNVKDKTTWIPHTYDGTAIGDCGQVDAKHLFHSYYDWEMTGAQRKFNEGTPGLVYSKLGADGKVDTSSGLNDTAAENAPITMSEFLRLEGQAYDSMSLEDKALWDGKVMTGCWILDDTDTVENGGAWAYWSVPLAPGEATNLLLDRVLKTTKEPVDDWFYGIDVKLQAVTSNDFEKWNSVDLKYKKTAAADKLIAIWESVL